MDDKAGKESKAQIASADGLQGQQGSGSSKALTVAEYGMLGTSAVGTVAAVLTKQVAYAAAPLSVSLFLNLLQRQQLNRRLELQNQQSIQQAQSIKQAQLAEAKLQESFQTLQGDLETVDQRLAQQEKLERDRPDFASQIEQAQQAITAQLKDVQSSMAGFATSELLAQLRTDFSAQSQETDQLLEGVRDVKADLTEQTQQAVQMAEGLETVQADLQSYIQDHEKTHQELDAQNQTEAKKLNQRLAWLEEQLKRARIPDPHTLPPPEVVAKPTPPPELVAPTDEIATLYLNLGIDFGTRFTKVCFQNLSDGQSEIIPFRGEAPSLSDALLLSQIGVLPNGELLAGLSESQWHEQKLPGLKILDGLKMRLADLDLGAIQEGWRLEEFPELDEPEMVENLCAYYLSRVIQKSQAWVRENRPQLVANEIIGWSANVGVPVAYCDEQSVSDRFKRVLTLAWLLSNQPQTQVFTVQLLQEQMNGLRSQLKQPCNCHAIPEIGAESWSFLNSREAQEGYYLFFDIGDGTIDGCAFNYERCEDGPCVEFYHGQVQPLGVRALSQALADELHLSSKIVADQLKRKSLDEKLTRSSNYRKVITMMAQVVMKGGEAYKAHHPSEKDETYKDKLIVFLGGGGSELELFQQWPDQTYQNRTHSFYGIQGYEVRSLPVPKQLQLNGLNEKDFHRFAVAFGLSTDHVNLDPAIHLPQEMAAQQPHQYASQSVGITAIDYEDSRDAY